ncbi:MAG: peroxide stress protein YaaA [Rhodocyclaceae bacterium]|nr:peroxide stress protein YaaA [Rhodocyclaceae bacterium]
MLIVLSPAKALDYDTPPHLDTRTQPDFLDEAETLVGVMREKSPQEVAGLMKLSDPLASLNVARYQAWKRPFTKRNAKQAVLAFDGDVYGGLDARNLDEQDLAWAQGHVRILSGLYGLLRPLDLMQPYRLEMGTRLANPRGPNLYRYWGDRLSLALNKVIKKQRGAALLVNLASEEYFKAVDRKALQARVITPVFEEWKGSSYRIISFNAKRARGLMTRYAIEHRIDDPEALKAFDLEDYAFAPAASEGDRWVFRRGGQ